ncbi:MAG: aminoacyl-histidine dipeptidase [Bacteroidetes bacterium]|nr:aminoacyl-histidine dipeptidase [Bacteroidota bacterium]MBK9541373.1 aminoacyl-histidine dipeptidase [Bacteroidota bacterium]MBP6401357.1 aminoacyl-histidine dipeptidase [Bacteroidia bacterium]
MSTTIRTLSPAPLWNNFADLNAVPRASKKEKRVIEFAKSFGEKLGLPTHVDEIGNVIIKKPASPGMENRMTVALQGHLDMVHQKNSSTNFNFDSQGIEMLVEGDWVKANGTTLGADNGIGVASIMTLLASTDIPHPPLEALFTIDEETGMTGALGLKGGLLDAKIMLNLDTEDDRELTIGCAGGVDVTATGTYSENASLAGSTGIRIHVKGLTGGHSGMDIHKGRGNANKIMNRILFSTNEKFSIQLSSIDGGSLRNAIPRESVADLAIAANNSAALVAFVKELADILKKENHTTDSNLSIDVQSIDAPAKVMSSDFQRNFLRSVYACPNGIYRMSPDIKDLVQTSNNVARILLKEGSYTIQCLTRSAVDSEKMDLAQSIQSTFELIGAKVSFAGGYPGWAPAPDSSIVKLMRNLYKDRYKEEPLVDACHAGLECGIIGANYPQTEMISFGPNILGAHSPDEKVQISSVQKFWGFLLETLNRIPEAK